MGAAARYLRAALHIPVFLAAVLLLYWALVLAVLTGRLNLLRRRGRNDLLAVAWVMTGALRVRVLRAGEQELYRGGKCMYLANHRSWADFFLDIWLTEGQAAPLSRGMVAVAFPALLLPLVAVRGVLVFNKAQFQKGMKDVEGFNRWIDRVMERSPHSSILVYPEGHRRTGQESQPLKRGMLHYAFSRNLPIQIVMSANKEAVLAEKGEQARLGQTVVTCFSELLEPSKYHDFEEFAAEVQRDWSEEWARAHGAPMAGLPKLRVAPNPLTYSPGQQAKSAAVLAVCLVTFFSWLYISYALAAWVGGLLGGGTPVLASLLIVWAAASFWEASQPVDLRGGKPTPVARAKRAGAVRDSATEEVGAEAVKGPKGEGPKVAEPAAAAPVEAEAEAEGGPGEEALAMPS